MVSGEDTIAIKWVEYMANLEMATNIQTKQPCCDWNEIVAYGNTRC